MKNEASHSRKMNRRLVLQGAGGLMLGLPLLEAFMPRQAAAQAAMRSPFVIIVVNDNGVVQAGVSLSVANRAREVLANSDSGRSPRRACSRTSPHVPWASFPTTRSACW